MGLAELQWKPFDRTTTGARRNASGVFSGMSATISPAARVLVVDDETLIRWSLHQRLSGAGYEVHEAGDGSAALKHFENGQLPVDLVLLDLKLPDTDGLSLLRRIRRHRPDCPVILMTAFGSPEALQAARNDGVYEVVSKPFDLDYMVGLVRRALA